MADFEFEELDDPKVAGITLRSKKHKGAPETGIYLPPKHAANAARLNVLVWLHGFYVLDIEDLFRPKKAKTDPGGKGDARIRQIVLDTDEDLVVIAPFLGYVDKDGNGKDDYGAGTLGAGRGGQDYLLQVLKGLQQWLKTCYGDQGPSRTLDIDKLYIACHSGGGYGAMINLVDALGQFKAPTLKECWGFDCLYPAQWQSFCQAHTDLDLYFYSGQGTQGPGARAVIFGLSQVAYGTPSKAKPASMRRVFLAPTFAGVEKDSVAFQPTEYYQKQAKPATTYEQMRKTLDPLLDGKKEDYWKAFDKNGGFNKLMGHYEVATALLGPRIKHAIHSDSRAP